MNRADVWIAHVGRKPRPVLILTRPEVIDVRLNVTVAEITTTVRGLAVEVPIDHVAVGLDSNSVVNCDGIHTIPKSTLVEAVGAVDELTMTQVCRAAAYAMGCPT